MTVITGVPASNAGNNHTCTATEEALRFWRHSQGWEYRDTGRPLREGAGQAE